MIPKVEGISAAIAKGLGEAVIIDGRVPHAILLELLSDRGFGTLIK
jgi:acetylglutamate kinase